MEFQIRIERMIRVSDERSDSLEYIFGPSPSINYLFERLGVWLDNEANEEYKYHACKAINEVTSNPAFDDTASTWPILLSFCVSTKNTVIDVYIVEYVGSAPAP